MTDTAMAAAFHAGNVPGVRPLTPEQRDVVRAMYPEAPKASVDQFLAMIDRTGLDPFCGQIILQKRESKREGIKWQTQTTVAGLRVVAERTGLYEGQNEPAWCGPEGKWESVWLDDQRPPTAAKIGVFRRGFREPMIGIARWKTFAQMKYEGGPTAMWAKMDDLMLSKCAEALALRKAFPQQLAGLYTPEEMDQAGDEAPAQPAPPAATAAPTQPAPATVPNGPPAQASSRRQNGSKKEQSAPTHAVAAAPATPPANPAQTVTTTVQPATPTQPPPAASPASPGAPASSTASKPAQENVPHRSTGEVPSGADDNAPLDINGQLFAEMRGALGTIGYANFREALNCVSGILNRTVTSVVQMTNRDARLVIATAMEIIHGQEASAAAPLPQQ